MKKGLLVVVSGFAGTGKGTLMKRLVSDYDDYALSVSMTTRSPRPGEEHGREYYFVTKEEFEEAIENHRLIEYAKYVDNYYGTPRTPVDRNLEAGKNVILEIEIQGALKVREMYPDALLLFVMPPSAEELKRRLVGRGTETLDVIEKRMKRAVEESEGIEKYDFILINDDLETCLKQMHEIIKGAKYMASRNVDFIEKMRDQLKAL